MRKKNMYFNNIRATAGVTILILIALFSNIHDSFKMLKTYPEFLNMDKISANETKFIGIKNYLKNVKEVGYITEVENSKDIFNVKSFAKDDKAYDKTIDIMAELILTQYSLSPIFVYNQTDLPLVVGNFPQGLPDRNFLARKHLIPVKVFPNGVVLLRKEAG